MAVDDNAATWEIPPMNPEVRSAAPGGIKQAVVVLGMHRSGASALARALSLCGFALPGDLRPAQPDSGLFEPLGVVRLNSEIFAALNGAWDQPEPMFSSTSNLISIGASLGHIDIKRYENTARDVLRLSFGEHKRVLLTDPRICLVLPIWRQALVSEGFEPTFIHIYRNPLEVAHSLRARNGLPLRRGVQLWQFHVSEVLGLECSDARLLHVAYNELLSNPRQTLQRVVDCIAGEGANVTEEAVRAIQVEDRHHHTTAAAFTSDPLIPRLVRATWRVLTDDSSIPGPPRLSAIVNLQSRVKDATDFLAMPDVGASSRSESVHEAMSPLLLHYHLFKNAGTSIDEALKYNFGARWTNAEFRMPANKPSNVDEVEAFLNERSDLLAFSSHTALLPAPKLKGRKVLPFLFIRHPIDRLMSAYSFERKQVSDTYGAKLAKRTDFSGYLRAMLDEPGNRQARNFHTQRLAFNEPPAAGAEIDRALRALQSLFFVGLVEEFTKSLAALEAALKSTFPEFTAVIVHENKTHETATPLAAKLAKIEALIGTDLYRELCAANESDLQIFDIVRSRYEAI